ncbi:hypothetical protein FHS95_003758 [Sphingomonas naasensis]|uniref:Uncharacterized protein n=1 Tax=Sphingomonas naasensis TaxID=1344951 RepID=A0A4S1WGP2_9SPHN|nr:hypothetical protein [Sphingomonas naasensis]NIJ22047.1 hypothetical protein [Sphingomonas naasensis]TGX42278.1 hypothetical protein E5A74_10510 [Sphingomonas naasensis]
MFGGGCLNELAHTDRVEQIEGIGIDANAFSQFGFSQPIPRKLAESRHFILHLNRAKASRRFRGRVWDWRCCDTQQRHNFEDYVGRSPQPPFRLPAGFATLRSDLGSHFQQLRRIRQELAEKARMTSFRTLVVCNAAMERHNCSPLIPISGSEDAVAVGRIAAEEVPYLPARDLAEKPPPPGIPK